MKLKPKIDAKQQAIQNELLKNTVEEGEIITSFVDGKMTPDQFMEKFVPIEQRRVESVIDATKKGFKVEKIQES